MRQTVFSMTPHALFAHRTVKFLLGNAFGVIKMTAKCAAP